MNQVLTNVGSVKGKLAYMAPEHASSRQVDRRSDVFVVGLILWELVAKRRLVTGTSSAQLLQNLLTMDFPPLSCEAPDVHPILEAIAMRALQRDPADRYTTALEMREALESYIGVAKEQVRTSDLARLMGGLFASARAQMATKIRTHMQSSVSMRSPVAAPHSSPSGVAAMGGTAITSIVDMGPPMFDIGPAGGDTNGPAIVTPPVAAPRREGRTALAVSVLALSMLALAVAMMFTRRAAPPPDAVAAGGEGSAVAVVPTPVPMPMPPAPVVIAPPSASVAALAPPPEPRPTAPPASAIATSRPAGGARPLPSARPTIRSTRPIDTSFPR